jgi:SAM-dependent methyltransferase
MSNIVIRNMDSTTPNADETTTNEQETVMPDTCFSTDWFTGNIPNLTILFQNFLPDSLNNPIKALEIGSWEGRSTTWFLENFLTHQDSHITCVDPWPSGEVFMRFIYNTRKHCDKIDIKKGFSGDVLRAIHPVEQFDFIYIDGSHTSWDTLEDAVLSFKLLKPNGIMVFDDYLGGNVEDTVTSPFKGINAFIESYDKHIEVIYMEYQVFIRKNAERFTYPCSTTYAQ